MELKRYKRKAAAKVLLLAFGQLNTISNSVLIFGKTENEWGDGVFTDKEREYLDRVRTRLHDDGEALRKLAWRLSR